MWYLKLYLALNGNVAVSNTHTKCVYKQRAALRVLRENQQQETKKRWDPKLHMNTIG